MDSTKLFENSPSMTKLRKSVLNRWKLETLTGLMGYRAMQHHQSETEKNIQAENQHVRKKMWGYDEKSNPTADNEMRDTILGDVTHPAPIIMPQPQTQSPIPALALAAVTGLAGYWLATRDTPTLIAPDRPKIVSPEFDDTSISIGLGRIEDYLDSSDKGAR